MTAIQTNAQQPAAESIALDEASLALRDPLLILLSRIGRGNTKLTWLIAMLLYMVTMFLPGFAMSAYYERRGLRILSLWDYRELAFAAFAFLFVAPILWIFFEWQLRGFIQALQQLEKNRVLGKPRGSSTGTVQFLLKASSSYRRPLVAAVPPLATLLGAFIWSLGLTNPTNPFLYGGLTPWWLISGWYLWLVWLPIVLVNLYVGTWVVLRQVLVTQLLQWLFGEFELEPKIFHADQCNGMWPVGSYILKISLIAVVFGIWVASVISLPMFFGQAINLKIDAVLLFALYLVMAPSVVILSTWGTHRAMARARERLLNELASHIQAIMSETELNKIVDNKGALDELQKRYELMKDELKTWPFQPPAIRGFALVALAPIASSVVSFVVDRFLVNNP